MKALEAKIAALVTRASPPALDRLQVALATGRICPDSSPAAVAAELMPLAIYSHLLVPFLRAWKAVGAEVPPGALALCIGAARRVRDETAAQSPELELVWTGPVEAAGVHARATVSVLTEMIAAAQDRVLVVGYNLTAGNELSTRVVGALADARAKGRAVTVALHDQGSNHTALLDLWPRRFHLPRLLRWVGQPGDEMASLHAKLLAVDGKDLLITSANLTYHGLEKNLEMGVRIRGAFALEVERHFAALERQGVLVAFQESAAE